LFPGKVRKTEEYYVYFPFLEPQPGSKRSAVQPQMIDSEFPQPAQKLQRVWAGHPSLVISGGTGVSPVCRFRPGLSRRLLPLLG